MKRTKPKLMDTPLGKRKVRHISGMTIKPGEHLRIFIPAAGDARMPALRKSR